MTKNLWESNGYGARRVIDLQQLEMPRGTEDLLRQLNKYSAFEYLCCKTKVELFYARATLSEQCKLTVAHFAK